MSRQPRRGTRVPGPPGSLCALLALLLVALPGSPVKAGPVAAMQLRELRCICLTTSPRVQLKMITNLQVIAAGPQCAKVEVIATLKNRKDPVCLDPQAPRIKKVVETILESNQKNKRKNQALGNLPSSEPISVRSQ